MRLEELAEGGGEARYRESISSGGPSTKETRRPEVLGVEGVGLKRLGLARGRVGRGGGTVMGNISEGLFLLGEDRGWGVGDGTFFVAQLEAGEVVAEDLGVGVVAVAVGAAAAEVATSSYAAAAVWLGGRVGGIVRTRKGGAGLEFFGVFAVDSFFEVHDPAVDFGLRFEKAFADAVFDYWEVVCCWLVLESELRLGIPYHRGSCGRDRRIVRWV